MRCSSSVQNVLVAAEKLLGRLAEHLAQDEQAPDAVAALEGGDLLAHPRIRGVGMGQHVDVELPVAEQAVDPAALVLHLAHHLPEAAVQLTDQVGRRHVHVLEEHLAEVVAPGHVHDRHDRDPRRPHVDDQLRQPGMGRRVGVGAGDQVDPVGRRSTRVPDLLAVDHEVVAVAHGAGPDGRHVRSGVRLRHADAPCRRAVEDRREVGQLLLGGAELQEGGAHLAVREPGGGERRPGADERLEHHEPLERGASAASGFDRPGHAEPAALAELQGEGAVGRGDPGVLGEVCLRGRCSAHVLGLGLEGHQLRGQLEVHRVRT